MLDGVTRTNRNARHSPGCPKQTVPRLIDDISLAYEVPISEELVGRRKWVRSEQQEGDGGSGPAVPGRRRPGSTDFMGRKALLKKGLRINPI